MIFIAFYNPILWMGQRNPAPVENGGKFTSHDGSIWCWFLLMLKNDWGFCWWDPWHTIYSIHGSYGVLGWTTILFGAAFRWPMHRSERSLIRSEGPGRDSSEAAVDLVSSKKQQRTWKSDWENDYVYKIITNKIKNKQMKTNWVRVWYFIYKWHENLHKKQGEFHQHSICWVRPKMTGSNYLWSWSKSWCSLICLC